MPTYTFQSRQWIEAEMRSIERRDGKYIEMTETELNDEYVRLMNMLPYAPEGAPTYSPAELEAAGQGVIEL
jgi:hypothetical protein